MPGIQVDEQFQASLLVFFCEGLLASVAYITVHLVHRLLIHTFGWKPMQQDSPLQKSNAYDVDEWTLAWSKLDIYLLGRFAWYILGVQLHILQTKKEESYDSFVSKSSYDICVHYICMDILQGKYYY